MVLKEVEAVWPRFQETEVAIRHFCRVKWRNSESQHEEQDAQREDVGRLRSAREVHGVVDLRRHVDGRPHLLRDQIVLGLREAKVAVLEQSLVVDEDVLQLDVHVRKLSLVVHLLQALHQLKADRPHQLVVTHDHALALRVGHAFQVLALHVLVDELEQIAVLTVFQDQEVADLHQAVD